MSKGVHLKSVEQTLCFFTVFRAAFFADTEQDMPVVQEGEAVFFRNFFLVFFNFRQVKFYCFSAGCADQMVVVLLCFWISI